MILITRPLEDAEPLAAALVDRGYDVQIEPLLTIIPLPDVAIPPDDLQGILATSANGVRALAAYPLLRALPLWAVGDATARAARDLGFTVAGCAGGDVDSLAALVTTRVDPARGVLLHAAGTHRAGHLAEILSAQGFETRRAVLYRAAETSALSPSLQAALIDHRLSGALFFSPRTATTFVRLIGAAKLDVSCDRLAAYCLSPAVAERLADLPWRTVRVARRPDQDSLLALLDSKTSAC